MSKKMDMSKKILLGFLVSMLIAIFLVENVHAESQVCIVYFTGIGCPHCAKTDPVVLEALPKDYGGKIVIIEYEIYQHRDNVPIFQNYDSVYKTGLGIPLVIFGGGDYIVGDTPILQNIRSKIDDYLMRGGNPCPMMDGSSQPFDEINIESLPGSPNILSEGKTQKPVTGKVVEQSQNFNWIIIGGIVLLIVVIFICFKIGIKMKIKTGD